MASDDESLDLFQECAPAVPVVRLSNFFTYASLKQATVPEEIIRLDVARSLSQSYLPPEIFDALAGGKIPALPFSPAVHQTLSNLCITADHQLEIDRQTNTERFRSEIWQARRLEALTKFSAPRQLEIIQDTLTTHPPAGTAELPTRRLPPDAFAQPTRYLTGRYLFEDSEVPELLTVSAGLDEHIMVHKSAYPACHLVSRKIPIADVRNAAAKLDARGTDVQLALLYDHGSERVATDFVSTTQAFTFDPPKGADTVRFAIRFQKYGQLVVSGLELFPADAPLRPPHTQLHAEPARLTTRTLVLTPDFPDYDNPYQSGYVLSRLRAYREAGLDTSVFLLSNSQDSLGFREFDGFEVFTGNCAHLRSTLRNVDQLLVHRMRLDHATAIRDFPGKVCVWIHGYEIQAAKHRAYLKQSPEAQRAFEDHASRMAAVWRELFTETNPQWHFIFVSQYLADQSFTDLGLQLPAQRFSVIPNPIDTTLFAFHEKLPSDRYRILSLRPYQNETQGNDLAVAAVLELSRRPDFSKYSFSFVGDGPAWDSTTAPLRNFPNVELRQGFIRQQDIPDLYEQFGVFLIPTRMDSQGVSRSEAMSSGLVAVTNRVAAVPEFADDECAVLVEPEDPVALADAIENLAASPDLFAALSAAGRKRTVEQLSADVIIPRELELIRR